MRERCIRIASGIDVAPLRERLLAHPEWWDAITIRQEFSSSAHRDTRCIYPRGPYAFTPYWYFYDCGAYDYPVMDELADVLTPILRPLLREVLQVTQLGRVLIVALKPGGIVTPHVDEGAYADRYARFHVAVTDSPNSALTVDGRPYSFDEGDAWWFDHTREHSAHNHDDQPRIHVIVDAVTPKFPMGTRIESTYK